jgi:hypothetical protein
VHTLCIGDVTGDEANPIVVLWRDSAEILTATEPHNLVNTVVEQMAYCGRANTTGGTTDEYRGHGSDPLSSKVLWTGPGKSA